MTMETARAARKPCADLHASMRRNFELARRDYVAGHKSRHWDVFPPDFERVIDDVAVWADFRRNGIAAGMSINQTTDVAGRDDVPTPAQQRRVIGAYRDLVKHVDAAFVRDLLDGELGNPLAVDYDGLRLDHVDLRLVYAAWQIRRYLDVGERPVLAEIGAGFGGLAAKLKRLYPDSTVILFDLPEVNATQTYYLHQAVPGARFALYEDLLARGMDALLAEHRDFIVLPGWTIADLPANAADLVVNTRSMMEMNAETIRFYFRHLQAALRPGGLFYCANRYTKSTVGEEIRSKDYPFDANWLIVLSQPSWDQCWVHELAALRTSRPNAYPPARVLAALPPYRLSDVAGDLGAAARRLTAVVAGNHPSINPGLIYGARNVAKRLERRLVRAVKRRPVLHRAARAVRRRLS